MDAELRGKYGAFAEEGSAGVRHLRELREAGLTHVHLLPTYDFATVPEREENQLIIEVGTEARAPLQAAALPAWMDA